MSPVAKAVLNAGSVLEEVAVTLTAARAAVLANALADAERYRRDCGAGWCADCAALPDGTCEDHLEDLDRAEAYRDVAGELVHALTNTAGRDVCPPRPASDLSRYRQERTMTINHTTAASLPAARSLHEICEITRQVNCGHCWAVPGKPCVSGENGAEGCHVARFGRAMRRGLISGPDLIAVLAELVVFGNDTLFFDETPGGSR
jgi:hypothetical protein